jgi:hypothetical protein
MAGLQQVARHGTAHMADADETDAGHAWPPSGRRSLELQVQVRLTL